jgi:hypothetical protein
MSPDPFASGPVSSIFAWLVAIPFLLGVLVTAISQLFEHTDDAIPRWFVVWMTLCLFVFSPLRYMILQLLLASSYSVQSPWALFTLLPLGIYVPIIFGALSFVGIGIPILATLRIAFGSLNHPDATGGRLAIGAVIAPLNMIGGYVAFFWLLQFAAVSVHWLRADDVIGATNGPAFVAYNLVLKRVMPLPVAGYYPEVTHTDREMLRNHVATFYLGRQAEAVFVKRSYPELYAELIDGSESDRP